MACLLVVLLCLLVPPAFAAESTVELEKITKAFGPLGRGAGDKDMSVSTFNAGALRCIVLADGKGKVHYIFLLTRELASATNEFKSHTKKLHRYVASLAEDPSQVKLSSFASTKSAAVIDCMPDRHRTSFSRPVLGDSTLRVIDTALNCGGHFEKIDHGVVTMVIPSREKEDEGWALLFSLHKPRVELLGYSPPASSGKKEEAVISSLVNYLRLSRPSLDKRASDDVLRNVSRRIGVSRCISRGTDYAVVNYSQMLFVGPVPSLRTFVKENKSPEGNFNSYVRDFSYPLAVHDIPERDSAKGDAVADSGSGSPHPPAPNAGADISVRGICRFLGMKDANVRNDCVCLLMDGCRVVIPVPDGGAGMSLEDRVKLDAKYIYVRSTDGAAINSPQFASALQEMLDLEKSGKLATPSAEEKNRLDASTRIIVLNSDSTVPDSRQRQAIREIVSASYPTTSSLHWPTLTRAGKEAPERVKTLLALFGSSSGSSGSKESVPASHAAALKTYLQHLRKLEKK